MINRENKYKYFAIQEKLIYCICKLYRDVRQHLNRILKVFSLKAPLGTRKKTL